MTTRLILAGAFSCLAIYLFVSAPEKLSEQAAAGDARCSYPVAALFEGVNAINHAARSVYTRQIVGGGIRAGLAFGEDWAEPGVQKGPLPALFLRLTASRLERKPAPLGLYLGSDAPISASNLFGPAQMASFTTVKATRQPVFSLSDGGQVAMYPDVAGVEPCVTSHNEHPDSPKTDWQLGDVMGATTWTFPQAQVSAETYITVTTAVLESVQEAYGQYLEKVQGFDAPVPISEQWPDAGRRELPEVGIFMAEVRAAAATQVLEELAPALRPEGTEAGGLTCVQ